jgi:hypothetical protein
MTAGDKLASRRVQRWLRLGVLLLAAAWLAGCGSEAPAPPPRPVAGAWYAFDGMWTATGSRHTLRLEGDRRASIASFDGSLMLAGPTRPSLGFRAEAVVFTDSTTGMTGRAVWTDEHGDQVFSALRGAGTATRNRIVGTFEGGTGRYAGASGTYAFSWRFLLENEDGAVQGQSEGLAGRVQFVPRASDAGQRP